MNMCNFPLADTKCVLVGLVLLLNCMHGTEGRTALRGRRRRQTSQFGSQFGGQYPAFPMYMRTPGRHGPGLGSQPTMTGGYSHYGVQTCITEDIVCPDTCLMEDEWGCKWCPCGPANGMNPPVVSHTHRRLPERNHEEKHDCMGTILCMLTCKGRYKLGPKDKDGCQSCTCQKKNETKHGQTLPSPTPPPEPTTTGSSHSCPATDMCLRSCQHTVKLGPPDHDGCRSCACLISAAGTTTPPQKSCKAAKECMERCTEGYELGSDDQDGCPSCRCIAAPTKAASQVVLIQLTPPPPPKSKTCDDVNVCKSTCRYGYEVKRPVNSNCATCRCIIPLSPPPPRTTRKPSFISVLRVCPDAVHCMKSCPSGYTLESSNTGACPSCRCNHGAPVVLLCEKPLSCPQGCAVGYRCDRVGCPTCTCIKPSETSLAVAVHTTIIHSSLICRARFSCITRCMFGYKTGDNGCPTCTCLAAITDQPVMLIQTKPKRPMMLTQNKGIFITQNIPHFVTQMPLILPHNGGQFITQKRPSLPHNSGQFITQNPLTFPNNGAPFITQAPVPPINTSGIGCLGPACSALHGVGHVVGGGVNVAPIPAPGIVGIGAPEVNGGNGAPSGAIAGHVSALETCPDVIKCMINCEGNYNLTTTPGQLCPDCVCNEQVKGCVGASCLVPDNIGVSSIVRTTPSPGRCVAILHCVLTCNQGYDIGAVGDGGCPSCTCLD